MHVHTIHRCDPSLKRLAPLPSLTPPHRSLCAKYKRGLETLLQASLDLCPSPYDVDWFIHRFNYLEAAASAVVVEHIAIAPVDGGVRTEEATTLIRIATLTITTAAAIWPASIGIRGKDATT